MNTQPPTRQRRHYTSFIAAALLLFYLTGCTSLPAPIEGKDIRVALGADPVVVNAEQTAKASLDVIDWFLKVDHRNRQRMIDEFDAAHRTAEHLRRNFPTMVSQLRDTTKQYKANRDPAL